VLWPAHCCWERAGDYGYRLLNCDAIGQQMRVAGIEVILTEECHTDWDTGLHSGKADNHQRLTHGSHETINPIVLPLRYPSWFMNS